MEDAMDCPKCKSETEFAEIGKSFDEAWDIPCPACGEIMGRVADPSQSHIV
jgi:Zn finger protein HypA/HybF involved in hydrogenase expression